MSRANNTSYSSSMYNQEMKPLDYLYGPWNSVQEMLDELDVRLDEIEPGLTVGIIEDEKVVEYWNPFPIPEIGFIKKTPGGTLCAFIENYTLALEYAQFTEHVGNLVFVTNPEIIEDENGEKIEKGRGLYFVSAKGELIYIASDLWYGVFPEPTYDPNAPEDKNVLMNEDECLPVTVDGAAKVSDVYHMFKHEQLFSRKRLSHLEHHVHWMVSNLDKEEYPHMFVRCVVNEHGKIEIIHEDLDTDRVLMQGNDETNEEEFITVTGANVGGWKNGDVIKKGDALDSVLKKMFTDELFPTEFELPTLKLVDDPEGTLAGEEDDEIVYEVGKLLTVDLGYEYVDGKIQTYKGAETTDEGQMVNAGCTPEKPEYSVLKPNSDDFKPLTSINNRARIYIEPLVEGEYVYKVEVEYSESSIIPRSNLNTPCLDFKIPGGKLTDTKSFKVKYKFWSGKYDLLDDPTTVTPDNLEEKWLDKNSTFEKRVKVNKGEGYYVYAPADCEVIFDATGCGDISPIQVGNYTHILEDRTEVKYKLWYMLNAGTYFNLRVVPVQ